MRQRLHRSVRTYLACALLVAALAAAWSARAGDDARAAPATTVRDLDYGDVLFHFFQQDYFESIVRLEANRDCGRLPHHAGEAELLSGGLYLSLGLEAEATKIFDRLLASDVPPPVQDRARFYLARINYQRGRPADALRHIARIGGELPAELEPERRLLETNALMASGRYQEAATRLERWQASGTWAAYARYNLGVALVRSGDIARGRVFLEQAGTIAATDEEQASLRDRANLALGLALLQQQAGDDANAALSRVRLDGPFTNRALLALGWAEATSNHPDRALVPWLELQGRPVVDAAVQESLLAVPYAYVRLAANGQASQHYRQAVDAYAQEARRLEESITAIRRGGFLDAILAAAPEREARPDWFWQLQQLPDAPQTRYLYHLLASHEFQEGLKDYRDLRLMQANLDHWRDSLEAFGAMIEAREQAAAALDPRRRQALQATDLAAFGTRTDALAAELGRVEAQRDVVRLATPAEQAQWQALDRIEDVLQTMPYGPRHAELAERARLLRGVLLWQFDRDFKLRAANVHRDLAQAGSELAEARVRYASVRDTGDLVPQGNADYAARVAALTRRVATIGPALDATALKQEAVLADLAVRELQLEQRRLASYASQAQFALAALYDGAVAGGAP